MSNQNKQEIATAIYEQLLQMAESVSYGSIGVNFTMHNGTICKVEFTETKNCRFAGGEKL